MRTLLTLAVFLTAGPSAAQQAERIQPPNVILIFTDDQGYQDVGVFGSPAISTPYLDRMAAEGITLTSFYSAAPVCSPSRAALMTGCYAQRVGLPYVLMPDATVGLHADEVTIAELLRGAGYTTACIGKWHIGHHRGFLPDRHGFDYWFGLPYSNDMKPLPLIEGDRVIEMDPDQNWLTLRLAWQAVQFIENNRSRPFFLYLPYPMPHVPLGVSPWYRGKSKRGLYGDVIEELDWTIGVILTRLMQLELDRNTLVIFTSDNGPWLPWGDHGGSAHPLRGGKSSTWEGGMRVPFIARWPGHIPAGRKSDAPVAAIDLLPTIAAVAGLEAPKDRIIDGANVLPLLTGGSDNITRNTFYYYNGERLEAVRNGRFKLHLVDRIVGDELLHNPLYDLQTDIAESRDVAVLNPTICAQLEAMAQQFHTDLSRNKRPPGRVP